MRGCCPCSRAHESVPALWPPSCKARYDIIVGAPTFISAAIAQYWLQIPLLPKNQWYMLTALLIYQALMLLSKGCPAVRCLMFSLKPDSKSGMLANADVCAGWWGNLYCYSNWALDCWAWAAGLLLKPSLGVWKLVLKYSSWLCSKAI